MYLVINVRNCGGVHIGNKDTLILHLASFNNKHIMVTFFVKALRYGTILSSFEVVC